MRPKRKKTQNSLGRCSARSHRPSGSSHATGTFVPNKTAREQIRLQGTAFVLEEG